MFKERRTYKEFLSGEEGIASNILADRLQRLEAAGIIEKRRDGADASALRIPADREGLRPRACPGRGRDLVGALRVHRLVWRANGAGWRRLVHHPAHARLGPSESAPGTAGHLASSPMESSACRAMPRRPHSRSPAPGADAQCHRPCPGGSRQQHVRRHVFPALETGVVHSTQDAFECIGRYVPRRRSPGFNTVRCCAGRSSWEMQ
jgi:hypothetical protein